MDFLKAQLNQIQTQLSGLSASQKMLTGTLVVIMVMTMMFWSKYAGTAEMEPLLNQTLTDDEISNISQFISSKGVTSTVSADKKIMVPADRRWQLLAEIGYAQLLPRNMETGFDSIIKQINPLMGPGTTDKMWNQATNITLSKIISGFPGVATAQVVIDPTRSRSFDNALMPTATVSITLKGGFKPNKKLAEAATSVVSGAQSGLARDRVNVVIDSVPFRAKAEMDNSISSNDYIELKQMHEQRYTGKVMEQLQFIKGVIVSVTVDLETKMMSEDRNDVTKLDQKELRTETQTDEVTGSGGVSGDAGTGANTSASIASSGGSSTSSTSTKEKTEFQNMPSTSVKKIVTPAGKETVTGATVRVPMSYFAAKWSRRNPNGKDPDDKVLQPLVDEELPKIRRDVMKCTGLTLDDAVSVETYADVNPMMADAMATTTSAASSLPISIAGYTKEIAVGVLAVASLLMMGMMVRKSTPPPLAPAHVEAAGPSKLDSAEAIAGEVGEGNAMLDGMELDSDAIKSQQMLSQVSTLVKENPDAAAALVKRWLNRT